MALLLRACVSLTLSLVVTGCSALPEGWQQTLSGAPPALDNIVQPPDIPEPPLSVSPEEGDIVGEPEDNPEEAPTPYLDVRQPPPADASAKDLYRHEQVIKAVEAAMGRGVLPPGKAKFRPNDAVTRREWFTWLGNYLGVISSDEAMAVPYRDVHPGREGNRMAALREMSLVRPCAPATGNGRPAVCPSEKLDRLTLAWYHEKLGNRPPADPERVKPAISKWIDEQRIAPGMRPAVARLHADGWTKRLWGLTRDQLMNGPGFAPETPVSRADALLLLEAHFSKPQPEALKK